MTTVGSGREVSDEAWVQQKKAAFQAGSMTMTARITDAAGGKLAMKHSVDEGTDSRRTFLWNLQEGQWNGPWNLSAPQVMQRYLAKRYLVGPHKGELIYAVGPPSSPTLVQAPPESEANSEVLSLRAELDQLKAELAESRPSGGRRHHRGRRRRSGGS